jgi:acyl carrier protein
LIITADETSLTLGWLKSRANLGADSLIAIEMRNLLCAEADIKVPPFEILQAPSLAALAAGSNVTNVFKAMKN